MKRNIFKLRSILAMFTIVLFGLGFVASDEEDDGSIGVTIHGITHHALVMDIGDTYQVNVNAGDKALEWNSEDESVVTVDQNGLLTAVGLGETRITVYPVDGELRNGNYIIVTVTDKSITIADDEIDQSEAE